MPADTVALSHRFLAAQLAGDRQGAIRLLELEGLDRGLSLERILTEVVRVAQIEIGRLWQENRIGIAEEHLATAIAQLAMAHLYTRLQRRGSRESVLTLACVEGEMHDMGARIAADLLEMEGYDVRFLGANVPAESLVRQLRRSPPDLLLLSITMAMHLPALRRTVALVRGAMGPEFPILAGGGAIAADTSSIPGLEADHLRGRAAALAGDVRRVLAA